ncbi:unnamed protein product [Effrenium voratum]|nr:unnamed protein product [Effrenium voratum]
MPRHPAFSPTLRPIAARLRIACRPTRVGHVAAAGFATDRTPKAPREMSAQEPQHTAEGLLYCGRELRPPAPLPTLSRRSAKQPNFHGATHLFTALAAARWTAWAPIRPFAHQSPDDSGFQHDIVSCPAQRGFADVAQGSFLSSLLTSTKQLALLTSQAGPRNSLRTALAVLPTRDEFTLQDDAFRCMLLQRPALSAGQLAARVATNVLLRDQPCGAAPSGHFRSPAPVGERSLRAAANFRTADHNDSFEGELKWRLHASFNRMAARPAPRIGIFGGRKAEALSAKELTQLLASYARQSLWRSAAVLLEAQEVKDLPFLGGSALEIWARQACGRAEHWPAVCQLLERVRWDELKTADWPRVTTAAITAFGFGRWSRAHWALEKLRATGLEGLKLSAAPVNAAMRCVPERMGSFWQRVLVCAEELNLRGPCPDQITLNTAVQACASAAAWEAAVAAFKASALAVRPDAVSLNTAISACARAREWQRSLGLLLEGSVAPTVVSFNAAMRACKLWQWHGGLLRSFSSATGYGFIFSPELRQRFGRASEFSWSSRLSRLARSSTKALNDKGQPQCRQLIEQDSNFSHRPRDPEVVRPDEDTSEADAMAMFDMLPLEELEPGFWFRSGCATECWKGLLSK